MLVLSVLRGGSLGDGPAGLSLAYGKQGPASQVGTGPLRQLRAPAPSLLGPPGRGPAASELDPQAFRTPFFVTSRLCLPNNL